MRRFEGFTDQELYWLRRMLISESNSVCVKMTGEVLEEMIIRNLPMKNPAWGIAHE